MQHPVTTEIAETATISARPCRRSRQLALPTLWFWPNVDAGSDTVSKMLRTEREHGHLQHVHFFRNMNPEDFLYTLLACKCLIGNSSVGIRECAYLGVPSVNIGNRQRFRERGRNVIDVAYDRRAIIDAVERQIANGRHARDETYGDGTAGTKIADLLERVPLTIDKHLSYADGR